MGGAACSTEPNEPSGKPMGLQRVGGAWRGTEPNDPSGEPTGFPNAAGLPGGYLRSPLEVGGLLM